MIGVLPCQFSIISEAAKLSCFGSRGKGTAWNTWIVYGGVKPAFCFVAATPETIDNLI